MRTFIKTAAFASAAVAAFTAAPAFAVTPVQQINVVRNEDGSYGADFTSQVAAGTGSIAFNLLFPVGGVGSLSFSSSVTVAPSGQATGARLTGGTFNGATLTVDSARQGLRSTAYFGGADIELAAASGLPLVLNYVANSTSFITGNVTFGASAVPEPASWALMIGGFGIVGGFMRRRSARVTKTTFSVA